MVKARKIRSISSLAESHIEQYRNRLQTTWPTPKGHSLFNKSFKFTARMSESECWIDLFKFFSRFINARGPSISTAIPLTGHSVSIAATLRILIIKTSKLISLHWKHKTFGNRIVQPRSGTGKNWKLNCIAIILQECVSSRRK